MKQGTVVTIGTFDGMHLGHQTILREVRAQAQALALPSHAYAFSSPPRWAHSLIDEQYLLLPKAVKRELIETFVDATHPATFESVRFMEPEEFVISVLVEQLNARVVVEGETFRFGRHRRGDLDTLRSIGRDKGIDVIGVPPVLIGQEVVSSTRIRDLLRSGDIRGASACLGRPPLVQGHVVRGDQLGGQLGFPTANLATEPHILLPMAGIYLVHASGPGILANGLLYVGTRPTLGGRAPRCEVHLLDFSYRTLYGETLMLQILEKIRSDRAFPTLGALRDQIDQDVSTARHLLSEYPLDGERISS